MSSVELILNKNNFRRLIVLAACQYILKVCRKENKMQELTEYTVNTHKTGFTIKIPRVLLTSLDFYQNRTK